MDLSESTNSTIYELGLEEPFTIAWTIDIVDLRTFKIELEFNYPKLISLDGLDPDKLKFRLLKPDFFVGFDSQVPAKILPGQRNYYDRVGFVSKLNGGSTARPGLAQLEEV